VIVDFEFIIIFFIKLITLYYSCEKFVSLFYSIYKSSLNNLLIIYISF